MDTGGGVLNAAKKFNSNPFFVFNPDTIWSQSHLDDFKYMEEQYFNNNYNEFDYIIHAAAITRPMVKHEQNPSLSIKTNIVGTSNIVLACERYNKKIIYIIF